jgi:hypothetical protein
MKLLDSPAAKDTFERELERVRRWYGCFATGYVVMPEHVGASPLPAHQRTRAGKTLARDSDAEANYFAKAEVESPPSRKRRGKGGASGEKLHPEKGARILSVPLTDPVSFSLTVRIHSWPTCSTTVRQQTNTASCRPCFHPPASCSPSSSARSPGSPNCRSCSRPPPYQCPASTPSRSHPCSTRT